jgi:hypothetical protein
MGPSPSAQRAAASYPTAPDPEDTVFRRLALGAAALIAAGGLAVAAPGATPAASAASPEGHLVFIKGGNVWVSQPDGTRQVQLTTGGGYESPSMADNGRIAAIRGDDLVVLRPDGVRIAQFEVPTLFIEGSCSTIHETPPLDAVISPDGNKIVWSQLRSSNCGGKITIDSRTAITNATSYKLRGLVLGYDASWVGSNKVVLDDNGGMRLMTVDHDGPKGYDWFDSYDLFGTYYDFNSTVVSRDGTRVAYLLDSYQGFEHILDHPTNGDPRNTNTPGVPQETHCDAKTDIPRPDDGPVLDDLMFSPDGNALVHVEGNDVWTITGIKTGDCEERQFAKVLQGVTDVSWSAYTGTITTPDRAAPTVRITKVTVKKRNATVSFRASDNATPASALRFRCQVDRAPKRSCTSPTTFKRLKPGRHTVKVWAIDRAGNARATSAQFRVRR